MSMIELFAAEKRSRFAINLLLTLSFTNATISAGILTASPPNLITLDFLARAGEKVTYMGWLVYGFPPALVATIITWAYIQWYYKPEKQAIEGGDAYIAQNLRRMGKVKPEEWRVMVVFLIIVLLWAVGDMVGIDTTTSALLGVVVLMMPRVGVITWDAASKEVSWGVLMVCGGGLSLGDVLIRTGAAKWLSTQAFGALGLAGLSAVVILLIILFITQYMHLLFAATTSMAAALLPLVMTLAQAVHMDVRLLMMAVGMVVGGYPLLMFYNTLPSIVIYGTGRLQVGDFPRVGIVLCAIACFVYVICYFTYWQWL
jgi:anion transporter